MANQFLYTLFIIIHGTWSCDAAWYVPGGDFFEAVQKAANAYNDKVIPFRWSGALSHTGRVVAAEALAQLIASYPANVRIVLIAHSHGGNVALMALNKLGAAGYHDHVAALYTLGTPVYKPPIPINLHVLGYLYNFISFADLVQPVVGCFEREQATHPRIVNCCVTINGYEPDHVGLHDPIIGRWIFYLEQQHCMERITTACDLFEVEPRVIHFFDDQSPRIEVCLDWELRIEQERAVNDRLWSAITKKIVLQNSAC